MADLALAMRDFVKEFCERNDHPLDIRIGINMGSVIAGVIGKNKFAFDLWGECVKTASRMESHGLPGKIQVTEVVYEQLKENYHFEARGSIDIKGIGHMETWLLLGKK